MSRYVKFSLSYSASESAPIDTVGFTLLRVRASRHFGFSVKAVLKASINLGPISIPEKSSFFRVLSLLSELAMIRAAA